jgi:hypothetical protein
MLTKYGQDKQACVDFFSEALRGETFYKGAVANWKLLPFNSAYTMVKDDLLPFFPDLISRLETGEAVAMPNSGYMMAAELNVMQEELTKLMDGKQTVQQTMDNMTKRIAEKIAEME